MRTLGILAVAIALSAGTTAAQGTGKYNVQPRQRQAPAPVWLAAPTSLALASATGSDECASATAISGLGSFAYDNRFATSSAEGQSNCECFGFGSSAIADDVWFRWTAPSSGMVSASLCANLGHDSRLAVYADPGCPQGPPLACDDDWCAFVGASQVSWFATAGASYLLQLGNFSSGGGVQGLLQLSAINTPSNDACATPTLIAGAGPHLFDNSSATTGAEGQCESLCLSVQTTTVTNDVWFVWVSAFDGVAELSLCGSGLDTRCAVYAGSACPTAGSALACDDDGCFFAGPSRLSFPAQYGHSYLIQIGSFPSVPGGQGSFTVQNTSPQALWTPVCVAGAQGVGPCPCSNPALNAGAGCNNSSATGGARLFASGNASLANDTLQFSMQDGKPTAATVLLQGTSELSLGSGSLSFGQGLRCVGGSLLRLYVVGAVAGSAQFPPPASAGISARAAALGDNLLPLSMRTYMAYYRDPIVLGACSSNRTFNASNGGIVVWGP